MMNRSARTTMTMAVITKMRVARLGPAMVSCSSSISATSSACSLCRCRPSSNAPRRTSNCSRTWYSGSAVACVPCSCSSSTMWANKSSVSASTYGSYFSCHQARGQYSNSATSLAVKRRCDERCCPCCCLLCCMMFLFIRNLRDRFLFGYACQAQGVGNAGHSLYDECNMFVEVYTELFSAFEEILTVDTSCKAFGFHLLAHGRDFQADDAFIGAYQSRRGHHSCNLVAGIERL